jgi:hypothetical protein
VVHHYPHHEQKIDSKRPYHELFKPFQVTYPLEPAYPNRVQNFGNIDGSGWIPVELVTALRGRGAAFAGARRGAGGSDT